VLYGTRHTGVSYGLVDILQAVLRPRGEQVSLNPTSSRNPGTSPNFIFPVDNEAVTGSPILSADGHDALGPRR
jgi:hypothetical protein